MDTTLTTDNEAEAFWAALEATLPPVFTRKVAAKVLGGILSADGMANLDSAGNGPTVRVTVGKSVGYEKANFIKWLRGRQRAMGTKPRRNKKTREA